jgi:hypothetical protein
MDGNGRPIQVIISLSNDMILEEKQTKAPFRATRTRGSQGKGRKLELSFFACVKGWGFGAFASSIF